MEEVVEGELWPLAALSMCFGAVALAMEPQNAAPGIIWWHLSFFVASAWSSGGMLALIVAGSSCVVPLWVEKTPEMRCMHGMAWITHMLRLMRLFHQHDKFREKSWLWRICYVHTFHDISRVTPVKSGALWRTAQKIGAALTIVAIAQTQLLDQIADNWLPGALQAWVLRWTQAGAHFVASMYLLDGCYRLPMQALMRRDTPSAMREPWRATSLRDFWRRWNTVIGGMLREGIFEPCRSSGRPALGVTLTFLCSGLLHVLPIALAGKGPHMCASMFFFFFAQAGVIALERRFRSLRGSLWVFSALLILSPLFLEPFVSAFERKVILDI